MCRLEMAMRRTFFFNVFHDCQEGDMSIVRHQSAKGKVSFAALTVILKNEGNSIYGDALSFCTEAHMMFDRPLMHLKHRASA